MKIIKKIWQSAIVSYEGSKGFYNGDFLVKHPREDEDKYNNRKDIAYYTNIFKPKVNRYVGYLYKKTPVRTSSNQFIKKILDDVDNGGNSIDIFMSNFATNSKVRGVGLCLVDMSRELPSNLKEQLDNRVLPYLVYIEPERVVKFKLDKYKKFEFVEYSDSMLVDDKVVDITRYYDTMKWEVKQEDKILESGEHNLGICPLVYFSEDGEFLSYGEFSQASGILKRHYNLQSELDEILRYQTFPILTLQGDVDTLDTGVNNALVYDETAQRPEFISPQSQPAQLIQSRLKELEDYISTICYDLNTASGVESGIALDLKFQGLNSSLSKFSLRLEDFERKVFDVVCKYLSINNDIEINYAKDFSIIDVTKEIEIFSAMNELVDSPTYFQQKALQIINNDLTNIEIDTFDAIRSELEDVGKVTKGKDE